MNLYVCIAFAQALRAWHASILRAKRVRWAADLATRRSQRNMLGRSFHAWRTATYQSALLAAEASALADAATRQRALLQDAFRLWRTHAHHEAHMRALLDRLACWWTMYRLPTSIYASMC